MRPKKHFAQTTLATIIVLLVIVGCSGDKPAVAKERIFKDYHLALDSILKTPQGILRGVELGIKSQIAKMAEKPVPDEQDSTILYYEYAVDSLTNYTVSYNLEEDKVQEIEIQINSKDTLNGAAIFDDLVKYFGVKYNKPLFEKGYYVFSSKDSGNMPFFLTLTDNSDSVTSNFNLSIYREK